MTGQGPRHAAGPRHQTWRRGPWFPLSIIAGMLPVLAWLAAVVVIEIVSGVS